MKIEVFCRFRQAGFHCWPQAPNEYAYLRDMHRHEFHVFVAVRVNHNDRDVEFIALKRKAENQFLLLQGIALDENVSPNFGNLSCEQLALHLGWALNRKHNYDVTVVQVSEDGENGAVVNFQ